jgi:hypothetical protein
VAGQQRRHVSLNFLKSLMTLSETSFFRCDTLPVTSNMQTNGHIHHLNPWQNIKNCFVKKYFCESPSLTPSSPSITHSFFKTKLSLPRHILVASAQKSAKWWSWSLKNIKRSEMWQASGEGMYLSTFLNF